MGRVVWINGPFGVGKSTTAELLGEGLKAAGHRASLYDPEIIGQELRAAGHRAQRGNPVNYHEVPLWRERIREDVLSMARQPDVTVVVPQTLISTDHFDQIIGGLRTETRVDHFTLVLNSIGELYYRMERRFVETGATTGDWGMELLPSVLAAQADPRFEVFLDGTRTTEELVNEILQRIGFKSVA